MRRGGTSGGAAVLLVGAEFEAMGLPAALATTRGTVVRVVVGADAASAVDFLLDASARGGSSPAIVLMELAAAGPDLLFLRRLKTHPVLRFQPVTVVLPREVDEPVVHEVYRLHANCCVFDMTAVAFAETVLPRLLDFWFDVATVPPMGCGRE